MSQDLWQPVRVVFALPWWLMLVWIWVVLAWYVLLGLAWLVAWLTAKLVQALIRIWDKEE